MFLIERQSKSCSSFVLIFETFVKIQSAYSYDVMKMLVSKRRRKIGRGRQFELVHASRRDMEG